MSTSRVTLIPRGAILQALRVGPSSRNIVLNFNTAAEYAHNPAHFGATIGRVANRIHNAVVNVAGQQWALDVNDGKNTLHGGKMGWGTRAWEETEKGTFVLTSEHKDQGFPGEVKVKVIYTVMEGEGVGEQGKTEVVMDYEVELVGGADETVVNMTNHSYFNLSGLPTIEGTIATLATNQHLPLDVAGIPIDTSAAPYPGISASVPFTLGLTSPDVDDCFVFADTHSSPSSIPLDTRSLPLRTCATFSHPDTKIHLQVKSTEPAFQFYTGKYVDIAEREDGTPARVPRAGFCVEPSRFVDAAARDEWKGMVTLKKGEVFGSRIVFTAWQE